MRIVIKIGSNVLTREDGTLDITQVSSLVDQVVELRQAGAEVIVVSSGAVASGRSELPLDAPLDSVEQRQLFSAVGQVKLIGLYYDLFRERGYRVGQVLTTKDHFLTPREYDNQRSCMDVMLRNGVIPIVNENDTVCVTELMFTDNDELSGLIARMINADVLILLTNVAGIYDGPPEAPGSHILRHLHSSDEVSSVVQQTHSSHGRGGMDSKLHTALQVAAYGIRVCIAAGRQPHILSDLMHHPNRVVYTEVTP